MNLEEIFFYLISIFVLFFMLFFMNYMMSSKCPHCGVVDWTNKRFVFVNPKDFDSFLSEVGFEFHVERCVKCGGVWKEDVNHPSNKFRPKELLSNREKVIVGVD